MTWATKNPPKKYGRYLVTVQTSFGRVVRQADRCMNSAGAFYWVVLPDMVCTDVIAWMLQPKPFDPNKAGAK